MSRSGEKNKIRGHRRSRGEEERNEYEEEENERKGVAGGGGWEEGVGEVAGEFRVSFHKRSLSLLKREHRSPSEALFT